ncbi:Hypothetical protein PHPALM_3704 [Phytophthora palmivora]|uniref:Uncharacterized protein n=1 Tax=Phytophthora palmivora TaxID=4796 RepID=A0A2P4YLR2_9STRA|nr:Hypothetical protein PHPALM_3704 [Phytophthora palmivora]
MGAEVTKNELKFLMAAIMLSLGIEFPYALAHLMRRRNETSKYFRCMLPTLAIYLADLTSQGATDEVELSSDDGVDFFENGSDMSSWDGSDDASSESSDGDFASGYWSASDDDGDYNGSSGDNCDDNKD